MGPFEIKVETKKNQFLISTDSRRIQLDRVHRFLSTEAYWSLGIPIATVERAIQHSVCFSMFDDSLTNPLQMGFTRVVTDFSTFAWICDVYIEKEYRGKGLSKWLMHTVMNSLNELNLRRICLGTRDAHSLYEKVGFQVIQIPQNFLEIRKHDLYRKVETRD